jgi:hypothetical protein
VKLDCTSVAGLLFQPLGERGRALLDLDGARDVRGGRGARFRPPLFRLGGGKFSPYFIQPSKTIETQVSMYVPVCIDLLVHYK